MGTSNETVYTPVPVTKRNLHIHTSEPYHRVMFNIVKAIVRPSYVDLSRGAVSMDWSHTVMLSRGHWVDTRYVHSVAVNRGLEGLIHEGLTCSHHSFDNQ